MASILDLVKHYQHAIEKYPNDEKKILKCIDKLFNLGVTVQHLQETGVGRTVNALRKEPGDVGQAARALVYKWKLMVAAEESDHDEEQTQSTYNGYENGKTPEDTEYDSRQNKSNKYDRYSKKTEEENYSSSQHINGDYSGGKRKYNSSEEEEPHVKKSKNVAYNEGEERYIDVKVKKEHSETEHDSHSASSHSSYSDSQDSESGEEENSSQQTSKTKHSDKHHPSSETKHSSSNDDHKSHKKSSSSSGKPQEHTERQSKHSQSESRSTSEKSSKEKSSSSDKHKKEKESHKKEKSEHKSSDKEKRKREVKEQSSDQHRSKSEKHKSSSSSEKHKSHTEKPSSKSEKHSSSHKHKSDKEKHKHSPEKTSDKHKSKEHSSTSKDKHSSSSKEKVKDKSSSSKDKENSHKSDKKHSSSGDISVKENSSRSKSEKDDRKRSSSSSSSKEKKSHSGSSHSSKSNKSSNSKSKDSPKKKSKKDEDSEDGIDCGSGASFAEALGMISPTKPKKKPIFTKENSQSPNISGSNEDLSPAALLAPSAKLAPLPALEISALPEISPNYKPRPPPRFLPHFTDEDALSAGISSKNQRTKVYSGNKVLGKIPTLYEMCVLILQEHIDALEYTGGVPYEILKPVVDKATPQQLYMLEHFNPYLMEDTDHLWQKFCEKNFRNKKRQEFESWREMFMRCQEEQEHKLKSLTANIKMTQEAKKAPVKQTKMAYVDTVVKPPRNVARKQAQHGTAFAASASPAARVAALAAAPNVLKGGRPTPVATPAASQALLKPKKAPLMQKALQFMRGRKR